MTETNEKMSLNQTDERKKILKIYIGFFAVIILQFVPVTILQLMALAAAIILLILMYSYKDKSDKDTLSYNHMIYLIKTFWVGSLFMAIGTLIFTYIVWQFGDHSDYMALIKKAAYGEFYDRSQIEKAVRIMMEKYLEKNMGLFIKAGLVCIGPSLLYLFFRLGKGLLQARKNNVLEHPTHWF